MTTQWTGNEPCVRTAGEKAAFDCSDCDVTHHTNSIDVTLSGMIIAFTLHTVSSKQDSTHSVETW